jgi:predicted nucleic acid-binding protein
MIIQTALAGNATMILSEDMQDGMMIEDLKIINPFYHINAF